MNLYEIANEIGKLQFREEQEEISLQDELDALGIEFENKMDGCHRWIKNLEADANAYKAEADRLKAREKVCKNEIKRLKQYIAYSMGMNQTKKMKTSIGTISLSPGKKSLSIDDLRVSEWAEEIKETVCEVVFKVNKNLLKTMYPNDYADLPGVSEETGADYITLR